MPTPSYSPTDVGAALVVLLGIALDVLTGYGVIPALDPQTRTTLMASLTVVTVAAIAAYIHNRSTKTQAQAAVAVAQATASVAAAPGMTPEAIAPLNPEMNSPRPPTP